MQAQAEEDALARIRARDREISKLLDVARGEVPLVRIRVENQRPPIDVESRPIQIQVSDDLRVRDEAG